MALSIGSKALSVLDEFFSTRVAFWKNSSMLTSFMSGAICLIRAYRVVFAPLKTMMGLQGCCRFIPSCSCYAEEAICVHGLGRGLALGARRVLRCHPWGGMGLDPVPSATRHA
jgi:uncharacterized protein